MVRKIETEVLDDFTGEPARSVAVFGFRGRWYELDLTESNAAHVNDLLSDWAGRGRVRRTDTDQSTTAARRTKSDRQRAADIRAWARNNGWDIPARGRIPHAVIDTYIRR